MALGSDYDRWLTTDTMAEMEMEWAEQIIEHGTPYFEADRSWTRVDGRVVWSCEYCGGSPDCLSTCWTVEEDDA